MVQSSSAGRRIDMATVRSVVAGGKTICTRSPVGSEADNNGASDSTRCRLAFAISLANLKHQLKSANGSATRSQPLARSIKPSPGRLMQSSWRAGSSSQGRKVLSVKRSADRSSILPLRSLRRDGATSTSLSDIHRTEVNVPRHNNLNSVAIALDDGGWDADCASEHFR